MPAHRPGADSPASARAAPMTSMPRPMSRHVPAPCPGTYPPVSERAAPVSERAAPVAEYAAPIAEGISPFWPNFDREKLPVITTR